jgi:thioredoxin 1
MSHDYAATEPTRAEVDAWPGATLLEFGSPTCGYCRRAQPLIEGALHEAAELRHVKVADGPGRPLGRSFRVKLWPTLVVLRDGAELARVVRPADVAEVRTALERLLK